MATQAVAATGTLVKIGDGQGSETFTTIVGVGDISGPSFSTNTADVTAHDSGGWTQVIGTIKTMGEITFPMFYNKHATQEQVRTDYLNRTKRNFQIVIPTTSPTTVAFTATVTGFEFDEPVDGALTVNVTLTPTDAPTFS